MRTIQFRPIIYHIRRQTTPSIFRVEDHRGGNFRCARASTAAWDARWPPSCAAPGDFCPRSIPIRSSSPERFCGNGSAARAAEFPAADPAAMRGRAGFSGLESKFPRPSFCKLSGVGNFFHLCPIFAFVRVARMQELFVPCGFIAQEQQAFGIRVEPADGINICRKTEIPPARGSASRRR